MYGTVPHVNTPRLRLRPVILDDAPFVRELFNDPACLRFIGDKHIHSLADARQYIQQGPQRMYQRFQFGLLVMEQHVDPHAIGICGLLQRDYLACPDLGFALLPAYRNQGFVYEAAQEVLKDAFARLQLRRIAALTSVENVASIAVLQKLGMQTAGRVVVDGQQQASLLHYIDAEQATITP